MPWNASHTGLKQILVSEAITVEVKNAHEVSLIQIYDLGQLAEQNLVDHMKFLNKWIIQVRREYVLLTWWMFVFIVTNVCLISLKNLMASLRLVKTHLSHVINYMQAEPRLE
ncbi:uncharacterized protein [Rutidosis leptorrhynchoides]|uniref:uncharacterized protein n=1 Tax=Rutidosis leptorrhynchoides TaxID=125765 RepID=UPI003A996D2E